MFEELSEIHRKPNLFSVYTAETLWTEPHLAQQMLKTHLDQTTPLASRPLHIIDQTVQWLDEKFGLNGKRICDLGCGPGLYAERYAQRGAQVEGMDFSASSIEYATLNSDPGRGSLAFRRANYLTDALPTQQDLITLIYCDFCVLSPSQRAALLDKVHRSLNSEGSFVFDVSSMKAFETVSEGIVFARNYMDGFWTADECYVFHSTWKYETAAVSLDLFTIVEEQKTWRVYNWLQHFSQSTLEAELKSRGFEIDDISNRFDASDTEAHSFTVVARRFGS
ncbi:class I SAM-dependent methyltransferase [Pelagibius sp.]|uniref:class I SAM-dependent methyltransferase n=1 Tax=Pelagibius sp. TaxID=1931238 RepID=UPI003B50E4F7